VLKEIDRNRKIKNCPILQKTFLHVMAFMSMKLFSHTMLNLKIKVLIPANKKAAIMPPGEK
jgi:hypothetical protein